MFKAKTVQVRGVEGRDDGVAARADPALGHAEQGRRLLVLRLLGVAHGHGQGLVVPPRPLRVKERQARGSATEGVGPTPKP